MLEPRLALGTVQFGLKYGVANKVGRPDFVEIENILQVAKDNQIDLLDTAINYGDSESILGTIGISDFQVVTKLPEIPKDISNVLSWISRMVEGSLERLRVSKIHAIMLHRSFDLQSDKSELLYSSLLKLKEQGIVKKIGVSIYSYLELETFFSRYPMDIIQTPYNLIDRGINRSGWLNRLRSMDVEIHSRSAFLQGLLLMYPNERSDKFARWSSVWNVWDEWSERNRNKKIAVCLGFLKKQHDLDRIVVGVDSAAHLKEIIEDFNSKINFNLEKLDQMESTAEELINPSLWSKL
ncbi:aldo/keto reductase [Leptospira kanakyensis]|uniref:aldo/keto reductase n=1 Tax=Leptospira kanakyensis TaxID=2484968 RepID=UPI00223DD1A1|nr:aldo/keto reductase [Leptospira kanakyensis]MCW7482147.1 aldo/keto reductase [Leptospira kanakyensis]